VFGKNGVWSVELGVTFCDFVWRSVGGWTERGGAYRTQRNRGATAQRSAHEREGALGAVDEARSVALTPSPFATGHRPRYQRGVVAVTTLE
jgi:hypothetical protein